MKCEICRSEYIIKEKLIKKSCHCDEENRIIPLESWYREVFKLDLGSVFTETSSLAQPRKEVCATHHHKQISLFYLSYSLLKKYFLF